MPDSLHFFQPSIGIDARIKPEKGRTKTVKRSSHCRALLNTAIHNALKSAFTRTVTTYRIIPASFQDGCHYPERKEPVHTRDAKAELGRDSLEFPATLSMAFSGLRSYAKKTRDQWGYTNYYPVKGPIPRGRTKDFFFLADLLLGTLNVLLTPEGGDTYWRKSPIPRTQPTRLEYLGVSSQILLSPALTALFFGQLRLAAFLASADKAEEIQELIPEKDLRKALKVADREQCVEFLRAAKPWILRKETGLWSFTARSAVRFDRLLRYFEQGGDATGLFSRDVLKSWSLVENNPYGVDFHNRGFTDFMGNQGSGDKKVLAALKAMREKKAA